MDSGKKDMKKCIYMCKYMYIYIYTYICTSRNKPLSAIKNNKQTSYDNRKKQL